jgi:hypothetical protein
MLGLRRWSASALAAAVTLLVLVGSGPAAGAAGTAKKSCQLLKPAEITSAFGTEASSGTQQGPDCTWQVGELPLSLETVTEDAKATYESLRDLAEEAGAGAEPVKVKVPRGRAVFAEITSFKQLLVLKGKTFLFLRLLDIENTVDAATAQTRMTQLGKQALKRV